MKKRSLDDLFKNIVPASDTEVEAYESSKKHAQQIQKSISKSIESHITKPEQLSWLPTDTARSSIFQPIADQDLKEAYTQMIFKSSWGTVQVDGPPLNISDEGVLLAVLQYINEMRQTIVRLNVKYICDQLGITAQGHNYRRIKKSIKKLRKTTFDIENKEGKYTIKNIFKDVDGDNDGICIEIDPWFFEKFLINQITMIDLKFWRSLKGDICKALYRFLSSHRGTQQYYIETLVMALNMNQEQEIKRHRDSLKRAFNQLQKRGFLKYKYEHDVFKDIEILKPLPRLKSLVATTKCLSHMLNI